MSDAPDLSRAAGKVDFPDLETPLAALAGAPRELGLRALAAVLMEVSENPYRPRFERLERLFDQIADGSLGAGRTLHGCRIGPAPAARAGFGRGTLLVRREKGRRKTMKNNG